MLSGAGARSYLMTAGRLREEGFTNIVGKKISTIGRLGEQSLLQKYAETIEFDCRVRPNGYRKI